MTERNGHIPTGLKQKAKPYTRRFRAVRTLSVFLEGLLAAAALSVPTAMLSGLGVLRGADPGLFLLFPSALVCVVLLVFLMPLPPLKRLFARIDGYYGLKELLVTAVAVDPRVQFGSLILTRAERALSEGSPKEVFRPLFHRRYVLIPLFVLLSLVPVFADLGRDSQTLLEGRALAEDSKRLAERAEEYDLPYTREFSRRMEELAKELERESFSKKEALEEIEKLRRGVLRAIDDLERSYLADTGEELPEPDDDEDASGRPVTEGEGASIRGTDTAEAPDSGGTSEEEPSEKSFGKDDESQTGEASEASEYDEQATGKKDKELEGLRDMEKSLSRAGESLERSGAPEDGTGDSDTPGDDGEAGIQKGGSGGTGEEGGPAEEETNGDSESGGPVPGDESVTDETGEPYERMDRETRTGIPLEGYSEPGQSPFGAFIRALPEYSYSELSDREIQGEYRRQIEEAVTNEAIPMDLRRVVRDYFLILGSGAEETE